jgi:hypothetical protein
MPEQRPTITATPASSGPAVTIPDLEVAGDKPVNAGDNVTSIQSHKNQTEVNVNHEGKNDESEDVHGEWLVVRRKKKAPTKIEQKKAPTKIEQKKATFVPLVNKTTTLSQRNMMWHRSKRGRNQFLFKTSNS